MAFWLLPPCSSLCSGSTALPILPLQFLCRLFGRGHASPRQSAAVPTFRNCCGCVDESPQCLQFIRSQCYLICSIPDGGLWVSLTDIGFLDMKRSCALRVNDPPPTAPRLSARTKLLSPSTMPLLLLSCKPVTMLCLGLSPSFCCFAKSFSALIRLSHRPIGAACAPKTFASVAWAPSCATSILVGALHSYWPPQAAHHHLQSSFCCYRLRVPSRPTKCSHPTGNSLQCGKTNDQVTPPILSTGTMIRHE